MQRPILLPAPGQSHDLTPQDDVLLDGSGDLEAHQGQQYKAGLIARLLGEGAGFATQHLEGLRHSKISLNSTRLWYVGAPLDATSHSLGAHRPLGSPPSLPPCKLCGAQQDSSACCLGPGALARAALKGLSPSNSVQGRSTMLVRCTERPRVQSLQPPGTATAFLWRADQHAA